MSSAALLLPVAQVFSQKTFSVMTQVSMLLDAVGKLTVAQLVEDSDDDLTEPTTVR